MDEMSNKTGSSPLEDKDENVSKPTKSSNGEQPSGNPPLAPRAITSKRVVIPPNAKRIAQTKQTEVKSPGVSAPIVSPTEQVHESRRVNAPTPIAPPIEP